MSLAFGGAFKITHNAGEDNQGSNTFKKAKLDNGQVGMATQQGNKREVLGTITNNVDTVRVQPFRAAKQALRTAKQVGGTAFPKT